MKDKVEDQVNQVIMKSNDFIADRTMALLFCETDTWDRESTRLSLDKYVQLTDEFKNSHFGDGGNVSAIITTKAFDMAKKS